MKNYPIDPIEFADGNEEPVGYYSKGHHEEGPFRSSCIAHHRLNIGEEDVEMECEMREQPVRLSYWRSVHIGAKGSGMVRFVEAVPRTQGAYPVTTVAVDI